MEALLGTECSSKGSVLVGIHVELGSYQRSETCYERPTTNILFYVMASFFNALEQRLQFFVSIRVFSLRFLVFTTPGVQWLQCFEH